MERHNEAAERIPMDGLPDGAGLHPVVIVLCAVSFRLPYVNRRSRPVASESCHTTNMQMKRLQTGGGGGSSNNILPLA